MRKIQEMYRSKFELEPSSEQKMIHEITVMLMSNDHTWRYSSFSPSEPTLGKDMVALMLWELGIHGNNSSEKRQVTLAMWEAMVECGIVGGRFDDSGAPPTGEEVNHVSLLVNLTATDEEGNLVDDDFANHHYNTLFVSMHEFGVVVLPQVRQKLLELRTGILLKDFFRHDVNRDGKLSDRELPEVARMMGLDVRSLLRACEKDDDNIPAIGFDVFQELVSRCRETQSRAHRGLERAIQREQGLDDPTFFQFRKDLVHLMDTFNRYDEDNSGFLSQDEIHFMLRETGLMPNIKKEKDEIEEILRKKSDSDGGLNKAAGELKPYSFKEFLFLVSEIRQHRMSRIRDDQFLSFEFYDKDHSGSLDVGEVSVILSDVGIAPRNRIEQEELGMMIHAADEDGSGTIDFDEFQHLCQRIDEKLKQMRYEEEVEEAMASGFSENDFRNFRWVYDTLDVDGNEQLSIQEVYKCLCLMSDKKISFDKFEDLFSQLDDDGSGELDFLEFISLMRMIREGEGLFADEPLTLPLKAADLDIRILRRSLEFFHIPKNNLLSMGHEDLIQMFCDYIKISPKDNMHKILSISSVKDLYDLLKQRVEKMTEEGQIKKD